MPVQPWALFSLAAAGVKSVTTSTAVVTAAVLASAAPASVTVPGNSRPSGALALRSVVVVLRAVGFDAVEVVQDWSGAVAEVVAVAVAVERTAVRLSGRGRELDAGPVTMVAWTILDFAESEVSKVMSQEMNSGVAGRSFRQTGSLFVCHTDHGGLVYGR